MPPFRQGGLQGFVRDVGRLKGQALGQEKLRLDVGPQKLLRRHAVVLNKTEGREGGGPQNAHPAYGFRAKEAPQAEVDADGHDNGQNRKNELPHGQSKKQAPCIIPDFPVDLDFQNIITSTKNSASFTKRQQTGCLIVPAVFSCFVSPP